MRTITYRLSDLNRVVIHIGYVAENKCTRVQIDAGEVYADYPDATAALAVKGPTGDPYPVVITRSGDTVIWDVLDSALTKAGMGEIQLTFTSGETVVKSCKGQIRIHSSIVGSGTVPEPIEDFLAAAGEALSEMEAYEGMTATATTLAAGESATAEIREVEGHKDLLIGVPKGDKGDPGVSADVIDDTTTSADKAWSSSKTSTEIGTKYTKPSGGIPAADLASGVIPVLTDLIDDTAGAGDTDVTFSADKLTADKSQLLSQINSRVAEPQTEGTDGQVLTTDGNGGRTWTTVQGGGGTSDYDDLTDKPQINGNTLSGNKTGANLGLLNAPSTAGTSGQVLTSNGNGGQVWATVGSGSIVVDNTLSVAGAAADAKATGGIKNALVNITSVSEVPLTTGGYVYTAGNIGTVIDFSTAIKSNANYAYAIVNVSEGDIFCINAVGAGNAFLWTFINTNNAIIDRSESNATGSNTLITAPENASKLIINSTVAGMGFCSKGKPINTRISDIDLTSNGKPHRIVAGVIRNAGNGWEFIVDSNHQGDLNCVSVGVANNDGRLYVDYSGIDVKKVISCIFAPDEAFANAGYIMGASVGKTASYIQIFQYGIGSVSAVIKFTNGDNGVDITVDNSDGVSAAVWDDTTKTVNITHSNITNKVNSSAPFVNLLPTIYGTYIMRLYSYGGTNTRVEFLNPTTMQKVNTPDTKMSFNFARIGTALQRNEIDPSTLVSANGNIWFIGIFET